MGRGVLRQRSGSVHSLFPVKHLLDDEALFQEIFFLLSPKLQPIKGSLDGHIAISGPGRQVIVQ